ncbi:hypothetical protein FOL46_008028 [Perkinsus olseni]|uniref:Uncharacterized protein n=1 Tax=Perkinsus olseni TaxID=32597 RepID=A0A7J6L9Z3_PEROL|nr:hypothetical protein FOL46_008028 [Perkinsus olseni]
MGCCNTCSKAINYIYNFFLFALGGVVAGIAIWYLQSDWRDLMQVWWVWIAMFIGFIMIIFALLACLATKKQNRCMLLVFWLVTFALLCLFVIVACGASSFYATSTNLRHMTPGQLNYLGGSNKHAYDHIREGYGNVFRDDNCDVTCTPGDVFVKCDQVTCDHDDIQDRMQKWITSGTTVNDDDFVMQGSRAYNQCMRESLNADGINGNSAAAAGFCASNVEVVQTVSYYALGALIGLWVVAFFTLPPAIFTCVLICGKKNHKHSHDKAQPATATSVQVPPSGVKVVETVIDDSVERFTKPLSQHLLMQRPRQRVLNENIAEAAHLSFSVAPEQPPFAKVEANVTIPYSVDLKGAVTKVEDLDTGTDGLQIKASLPADGPWSPLDAAGSVRLTTSGGLSASGFISRPIGLKDEGTAAVFGTLGQGKTAEDNNIGLRVDYTNASYGVCLGSSHHSAAPLAIAGSSTATSTTSESCGVSGSSVASSSSTITEDVASPLFSGWLWGRTQFGLSAGIQAAVSMNGEPFGYRCVGAFSSASSGDSNYIPSGGDYQLVGEYNSATKSVTAAYHQLIVMQRKCYNILEDKHIAAVANYVDLAVEATRHGDTDKSEVAVGASWQPNRTWLLKARLSTIAGVGVTVAAKSWTQMSGVIAATVGMRSTGPYLGLRCHFQNWGSEAFGKADGDSSPIGNKWAPLDE